MSILPYMPVPANGRRPSTAGRGVSGADLAMAQRTELHLDLSDRLLTKLATNFHPTAVVSTCSTCGHATGCDCDCCRYPLPAVAAVVGTGAGA